MTQGSAWVRSVIAAIAICSSLIGKVEAAQILPELESFREHRAGYALGLSKPIAACVVRHDTGNPVFHGCIDWHSAVHGVWALTAYTWATGDRQYRPLIESLLQKSALAEEKEHLDRNPRFEMPYGRAWFLRLAIDYRHAFDAGTLDDFADDVADSLMNYYKKTTPDPTSIAYDSSTWALINLYDYGVMRNRTDIADFVREKVRAYYVSKPAACPLQRAEVATHEFMAVCSNWAWLVGKVLDKGEFSAWLPTFLPADLPIEPVYRPASVHQFGLNFSRAWGLWNLYRKTSDSRFLQLYLRHFMASYDDLRDWKRNYGDTGHWVAQFGMLATMVTYYDWR